MAAKAKGISMAPPKQVESLTAMTSRAMREEQNRMNSLISGASSRQESRIQSGNASVSKALNNPKSAH